MNLQKINQLLKFRLTYQIWFKAFGTSVFEMDGSKDHGNWRSRGGYRGRGNRGYTGERAYGSGHRRGYGPNRGGRFDDFDDDGYTDGARGSFFDEDSRDFSDRRNDQRGKRGRGGRPPPHLRGKEIGLWYARQSRGNAAAKERRERKEVVMEGDQRKEIQRLLSDIKSDRGEQNMPESGGQSQSRKDWFDSEDTEMQNVEGQKPSSSRSTDRYYSETSNSMDQNMEDEETDMEVDDSPLTDIVKEWSEDGVLDVTPVVDDQRMSNSETVSSKKVDKELSEEFEIKQDQEEYQAMMEFRRKLPSYNMRDEIVDLIKDNQVVVLSGETGCGKTTQVPQYILDDFLVRQKGSECSIICTQPRRISAISVAQRVAAERAEKLGKSVGYMIRLENTLPRRHGSILYCTTGILLRKLEFDPLLASVTHIILDEIHERDLLSDFLIIILKDLMVKRPDLKVVLMSATLNAKAFSEYYGNCPMINIPGYTFPVKEYYMEDVVELLRYRPPEDRPKPRKPKHKRDETPIDEAQVGRWLRELQKTKKYSNQTLNTLQEMDPDFIDLDLVRDLIRHIVTQKGDGAILVFVPGWAEISNLNKLLTEDRMFSSSSFRIIPLHSMMPTINQREVFERAPRGVRKIVIATNIAETSITIDDIVYVIDTGKINIKGFSAENNLMTLRPETVSLANARQRRGRAGRVQEGECFHLFTGLQQCQMKDFLPPEILRTPLEELCLQIKLLKLGKILPFVKKALEPPSLSALQLAIQNLQDLNALDKDENLLPLGKHLARMPLDPHTGKMLLFAAMFGCLDPILTIAASLSFKDPFFVPLGKEAQADEAKKQLAEGCMSDHILLVKTYREWLEAKKDRRDHFFCHDYFLSKSTLEMLKKMRVQLSDLLYEIGFLDRRNDAAANQNSDNMALVKSIVCAGLYPNVGKIKGLKTKRSQMRFTLKDESRCKLHPKSVAGDVRKPNTQWIVYHKKMKTASVYIYDCSLISAYSLLLFGGEINESVDEGGNIVTVDDWIKFKASRSTVSLVKDLRRELDIILDEKITKTHTVSWDHGTKERALIQAIIDLVTKETEEMEDENFSD